MSQKFKAFREYAVKFAIEKDACSDQRRRVENTNDYSDLLEVIKENIHWCISYGLDSKTLLEYVPDEELVKGGFYIQKIGIELTNAVAVCFASTVTAWGNSTVTARENSTVTARENSTVTAWENSTVTAWENSTVTARENSTVTARENSTVAAWENSTVTAWENSYIYSMQDIVRHP